MLRRLYQQSTPSLNPSYLTGVLPGGAGAATAGTTPNPGISSPYIEDYELEVFDVTAPTLINPNGTTPATPVPAGKLIQLDAANSGPGGWKWKQNSVKGQSISGGQYGIVVKPANALTAGTSIGTAGGNIANPGDKALVVVDGPVQAFVQTSVGGVAISAGMPLQADGAGNLTPVALGAAAGITLATAMDSLGSGISIPVLRNVYLGGY